MDSSFDNWDKLATENGINNYTGTAAQNNQMLYLLRQGKLKRPQTVKSPNIHIGFEGVFLLLKELV